MVIEASVRNSGLVQKRREQIVAVACRLFAERGFHETTMKDIAEACGLAFGSLYSYLETKEDVLYLVFEWVLTDKLRRVREVAGTYTDPEAQLREVLRVASDTNYLKQNEIQLLYRENATLKHSRKNYLQHIFRIEQEYVGLLRDVLERGVEAGVFRPTDTHLVANFIPLLLAIWPLKRWNLKGYTAERVTKEVIELVVRGIKAGTDAPELDSPQGREGGSSLEAGRE